MPFIIGEVEVTNALTIESGSVLVNGTDGVTIRPLKVDAQGRVVTTQRASTASVSTVSASSTSQTLLNSNVNRIGAMITNDSQYTLYVKFGAVASTTSYTVRLTSNAYYEVPFGYSGSID